MQRRWPKSFGSGSAKLTSGGSKTLPDVRPGESPPYNECMQSESPLDTLISAADRALRSVFAPARASRPMPEPVGVAPLTEVEKRESAALMRVNHAGEIAAQALYHGQALVARSAATRPLLLKAAHEETDHLAWCETRLKELELTSEPAESAAGMPARLRSAPQPRCSAIARASASSSKPSGRSKAISMSISMRLPPDDTRSRAILQTMRTDEIAHGVSAKAAGGAELPSPVRFLMRNTARLMTSTAYWI